jgi:hypothetical protein
LPDVVVKAYDVSRGERAVTEVGLDVALGLLTDVESFV